MTFFQFEADFVDSLRCIPMVVRYKLDTCGLKLKLPHWNQFTPEERQRLVNHPCDTEESIHAYREMLHHLVQGHGGDRPADLPVEPHPAWMNAQEVPATVQDNAGALGVALAPAQWANLTPLQRFALIKLSRSNHENRNFLPALREFHLMEPAGEE